MGLDKVVNGLEKMLEESKYNDSVNWNPWADTETLEAAIALLKAQEQNCRECGEATSKAIQELQTKLKAQEPRIVAISELTSGEPMLVWLEDIDKEETIAGMIFDYVPGRLGFKLTDIASMDRIYPRIENYLTRWRCWTSRPTEAQREATGWNERSVQ